MYHEDWLPRLVYTSVVVTPCSGHTLVPDLVSDISGSCLIFRWYLNLDTKPSSRDNDLVARLSDK